MRREGRAVGLINVIASVNYQVKNCRDRLHAGKMTGLLDRRDYSADTKRLVHFVMSAGDGIIRPWQNPWELEELMKRVGERTPRVVVEIGTAKGGTLFLFCQHAADDATIISIDLPHGRNGGGYPKWKEPLYGRFAKPNQTLLLLRADSHHEETRQRLKRALNGRLIDVLMIDADHSYEGVKRDYELYAPLVAEKGMIVLHDIVENRFDPEIEVHRFWDEIRRTNRFEEIIHNSNQGNLGIGIIWR